METKKVQTLNDLIRYGKTSSYSICNIALFEKIDDTIFLDKLIYEKYDTLIMGMCSDIVLTDEEFRLYNLHPERLAMDLYGNPNLAHLILYVNRCAEYEFNRRNIRLIPSRYIDTIFQKIIQNEQNRLNKNHSKNN